MEVDMGMTIGEATSDGVRRPTATEWDS
jgi:hypothetical protein